MAEGIHQNTRSLSAFLEWLSQKASGLSKQQFLNKDQIQELLLGVGLYFRDLGLLCFTDHEETPVPDYLANSGMGADDANQIDRILQLISAAVQNGSECVFYQTGSHKY